jgi:hypothetical protein
MKKNGLSEQTIISRTRALKQLARMTGIQDPETTKATITNQQKWNELSQRKYSERYEAFLSISARASLIALFNRLSISVKMTGEHETSIPHKYFRYLLFGLILTAIGIALFLAVEFSPLTTVKEIQVNEKSTDWYGTEFFYARAGDYVNINVSASGGSATLAVYTQNGTKVFGEVYGYYLLYDVQLPSDDAYTVHIWTRAIPFPSTYIDLTGSISFETTLLKFYPIGYIASSFVALGAILITSGTILYIQQRMKIEEEKKLRICPYCNSKVSIISQICPHCGFDIVQSIKCEYCGHFYDRSLPKCPNCGAKKSKK